MAKEVEVRMKAWNETTVLEFVLEGFLVAQHLGKVLFLVHLLVYLASVTGNTLIIAITWSDPRLQTPMYFFLRSFSFCECCFISTVIPKLLAIFLFGDRTIHFTPCIIQAFSFLFLGSTIFFHMAVMSLDRYLAICKPLRYPAIMNPRDRQKAFSTCSSHLIVLSLMYGSCVFIYVKPKQVSRLESNREAALVNTVVTPLLNPVIYTLRNKQVHQALRDALSRVNLQK